MTRTRHRIIATHRATAHLQAPAAPLPVEIENGALIDFLAGCAIAGLWTFIMWALVL